MIKWNKELKWTENENLESENQEEQRIENMKKFCKTLKLSLLLVDNWLWLLFIHISNFHRFDHFEFDNNRDGSGSIEFYDIFAIITNDFSL